MLASLSGALGQPPEKTFNRPGGARQRHPSTMGPGLDRRQDSMNQGCSQDWKIVGSDIWECAEGVLVDVHFHGRHYRRGIVDVSCRTPQAFGSPVRARTHANISTGGVDTKSLRPGSRNSGWMLCLFRQRVVADAGMGQPGYLLASQPGGPAGNHQWRLYRASPASTGTPLP